MTGHPGGVKNIFDVNLDRPRDMATIRKTPSFNNTFAEIWDQLREEVKR